MLGFLFYAEAVALTVEFCYTIAFRVVDIIAEDRCLSELLGVLYALSEQSGKS